MILYDNIEDTQNKLHKTICLYDGRACVVYEVLPPEGGDMKKPYRLGLRFQGDNTLKYINLNDPKFNSMQFNLGYANHSSMAYWWYRKPLKQYRQGLRSDQLGVLYSPAAMGGRCTFEFNGSIIKMLEGSYPSLESCEKSLKDSEVGIIAFHKDYALAYDRLHQDFIVERRGKQVGQTSNLKSVRLLPEFRYLQESLQEVMG